MYHWSPKQGLSEILPPTETGVIRPGEEGRRSFRDVVFATTSWSEALRYARGGSVYVVEGDAQQYRPLAATTLSPKKLASVGADIYVMPRGRVIAEYRCAPRRRGEAQRYDFVFRAARRTS